MAKQFAIIRVEKHKKGSTSAVNNHNFRNGEIESNIKKEKTKDNILLFGTNNIKNDINSYIETSGIKPRNKDTVLFQEFVLTASPEFFFNNKDGSKKTKEQYEKNLNDWIKTQVDYLKKENYGICVNAVVHLDESTPHIHAVVLPIKDGKFNCKAFYRGKNSYSKLLDQYATYNKKHG
ncbi:MobV family relaxase, partial [Pantoea sp. 3_1284]|uniref:MobV family relaxase n=1 Tax=Pantoea sp. 3_1284 TaxID=2259618 RepID=UPI000E07BB74